MKKILSRYLAYKVWRKHEGRCPKQLQVRSHLEKPTQERYIVCPFLKGGIEQQQGSLNT